MNPHRICSCNVPRKLLCYARALRRVEEEEEAKEEKGKKIERKERDDQGVRGGRFIYPQFLCLLTFATTIIGPAFHAYHRNELSALGNNDVAVYRTNSPTFNLVYDHIKI